VGWPLDWIELFNQPLGHLAGVYAGSKLPLGPCKATTELGQNSDRLRAYNQHCRGCSSPHVLGLVQLLAGD
jgi:hypothetical protein